MSVQFLSSFTLHIKKTSLTQCREWNQERSKWK